MIYYKNDKEIDLLKESSLIVSKVLSEIAKQIKPGVSTLELDENAEALIRDNSAIPGFKGYHGYPNTLCVSINDEVVHGIPNKNKILKDGDIVSIDCGVIKNGYYGDSAYTFPVGNVNKDDLNFIQRTKESLYKGIEMALVGKRLGDVGNAIQSYVENFGYSVVRDLVGHGLGKKLHEDPQVLNYGKKGSGTMIQHGLVICIEPMINKGIKKVMQDKDGWTIRTADSSLSAHFEHTIAIRNSGTEVLTNFNLIEKIINNNN